MFTFLTRITGASFPETVRDLGRRVGIEVQEPTADSGSQAQQANRTEHESDGGAMVSRESSRRSVGAERGPIADVESSKSRSTGLASESHR